MDTTTTRLTLDGLTVEITIERTDEGPLLVLGGVNCNLEGDMPGEYLLTPVHAVA